MNKEKTFIVSAAGGNNTALVFLPETPKDKSFYAKQGALLMKKYAEFDVEQVGFFSLDNDHLEMSGGEFCGNAARAVAQIFCFLTGTQEYQFTMSGFSGKILSTVSAKKNTGCLQGETTCFFPNLQLSPKKIQTSLGKATLVDFDGIVHVLIEQKFPKDYAPIHAQITKELGLENRAAVGVCWVQPQKYSVKLDPVVWVKNINSFFYETSCGSASIATAVSYNAQQILQPSGETILVQTNPLGMKLTSQTEVLKVL